MGRCNLSQTPFLYRFYPFYFFSPSNFRKHGIACIPLSIDDYVIIQISTIICYYYYFYISINFPRSILPATANHLTKNAKSEPL